MSSVNYIMHMNGLYIKLYEDDRLNPSHVSIYFALFKYWNLNRFQNPFSVARYEIMKLAKIKSPNTYSKCIKELDKWEYLTYKASTNPFKGSLFSMMDFTTSTSPLNGLALSRASVKNGLALPSSSAKNGLALIPSKTYKLNSINERKNLLSQDSIIDFFLSQKASKIEAQKFWNHYESNGWLIGGKSPMVDWHASAKNWIARSKELNKNQLVQKMDYLHTTSKKNYNESL